MAPADAAAADTTAAAAARADDEGEWFDLVDEQDRVIGRQLRSVCHRDGLLHRAVYCWVFSPEGQLLVQRRSPHKRIGPGQWDLSVAEHLQPGESYLQGAVRGLSEELGIAAAPEALAGPLAPVHRRELREGAFHDAELVCSFRMNGYTGPVTVDDGEVAEARWAPLDELRRHAEQHPEQYTQWFLQEAASLGWFGAAPGGGTAVGGEPRDGSAAAAGQQRQQRQFAVA